MNRSRAFLSGVRRNRPMLLAAAVAVASVVLFQVYSLGPVGPVVLVWVPVPLGSTKLLPATTSVPCPSAPGVFQLVPAPVCNQPRSVPGAMLHGARR